VVGVDGSAESEAAIDFAFQAAQQRSVSLHAVHAWKNGPVQGFRRTFHLNVDHDAADTDQLAELTTALADRSEQYPDVSTEPVVLRGHPQSVLLHYAAEQQASLLVVGASGVGDMLEQALGSTSRGLLAHADVPVAVVRNTAAG
ncbi:MAG: universal stress protein, partial [Nakamurella sp.]